MDNRTFMAWALEAERRWELIGGIPVCMESESRLHSRTARTITNLLNERLADHPWTPDQRLDVVCGEGEVRNPDVLIDSDPRAATSDHSCAYRPVTVFEVAVTSQSYDLGGKHLTYFANPHVRHYVVILPLERAAVHIERDRPPLRLLPGDRLTLDPDPGLTLEVDALLGAP